MSFITRNQFTLAFGLVRHLTGHARLLRKDLHRMCWINAGNTTCCRVPYFNIRMDRSVGTQSTSTTSKDELQKLTAIWPNVIRDVTDSIKELDIPDVTKWIVKFSLAFGHTWYLAGHARLLRKDLQRTCRINTSNAICWRRPYSNVQIARSIGTQSTSTTSKNELRELIAVWPDIVRDITNSNEYSDNPSIAERMVKVLEYNVPGGKMVRGVALVHAYKLLVPSDQITEDNVHLARILGWCMEMVQGFLLIVDDIFDESLTRRNKPCWYLYNNTGYQAISDSIMVEHVIYQLLRKYFKGKDCYVHLLDLFHRVLIKTCMGQTLDGFNNSGKQNLYPFTIDRYRAVTKYKTAYYSFILPIISAMHFAGIKDPEMFKQAETILFEIGHLYQSHNDYLDCYGNPEITGKIGTDIQEGKCTWLIAVALQRATPDQQKILEECYGLPDSGKIKVVKEIYNDLDLPKIFSIFKEETYHQLNTHIQQVSQHSLHQVLFQLLQKVYNKVS